MPAPLPQIELSLLQIEAITGSLLGDGTLNRKKNRTGTKIVGNASLTITRSIEDIDYLKYEASIFESCISLKCPIKYLSYFDRRKGFEKTYYKCRFSTCSNITFSELHHKWYRQNDAGKNIKIVPNDIKLSALTIAHWLADDGSVKLKISNNIPRFEIRFSTESFTRDAVQFLVSLLEDRYKEKFTIYKRKQGIDQYIISGLDSASRAIISDIDTCFQMTRKRLWDDPEARFYINQPERQLNRKQSLREKKKEFFKTLSLHQQISARDLAKQLGYWFTSDIRDEPNYHTLNKMIGPYLKSGWVEKLKDHNRIFFKISKHLQMGT